MLRILLSIITLFLLFMLTLTLGCGSEDDGITKPVIPVEGELTDVQFLFADDVIESDLLNAVDLSFFTPIYFLMGLPVQSQPTSEEFKLLVPAQSDDLFMFYINEINTPTISAEGWYLFEYDLSLMYETMDSVHAVGVDSVRLMMGDSPVEWTGIGVNFDKIESRNRAVWESNRMITGTCRHNIDLMVQGDLSLQYLVADISVLDSTRASIEDEGGFCYVNLLTTATGSDIVVVPSMSMYGFEYCADSGTVSGSTVIDLDCTEHSLAPNWGVEGLWTFEGVYNSANILSYKVTHGNTFWYDADTCDLESTP